MNDESIMPFGIHKGKRLIDVPAGYLIWLYEENKCSGELRKYIAENMGALKMEVRK